MPHVRTISSLLVVVLAATVPLSAASDESSACAQGAEASPRPLLPDSAVALPAALFEAGTAVGLDQNVPSSAAPGAIVFDGRRRLVIGSDGTPAYRVAAGGADPALEAMEFTPLAPGVDHICLESPTATTYDALGPGVWRSSSVGYGRVVAMHRDGTRQVLWSAGHDATYGMANPSAAEPALRGTTLLGGLLTDEARALDVGDDGSVVLAGSTFSPDFGLPGRTAARSWRLPRWFCRLARRARPRNPRHLLRGFVA